MKHRKLLSLFALLLAGFMYLTLSSSSSGMMGVSSTGCGGPSCHASGPTTIDLAGIPAGGYVAGTTYTLTLTVTNTSMVEAGFDLTCSSGTMSAAPANTMLMGGTELHHTAPKPLGTGVTTWVFNWTADTNSSVVFDIAANAVNGNNFSSGDAWATISKTYLEAGISAPTIVYNLTSSTSGTSANILASVNANGASTSVSIEYGLTTSYGSNIATSPGTVTGTTATNVTGSVFGLTPNTTYHYRIKATNSAGTTNGPDSTFKTLPTKLDDIRESDFQIYPNPVAEFLLIKSQTSYQDLRFQIVDLQGRVNGSTLHHQTLGEYRVDVGQLIPGNYFLLIQADDKAYVHSFLKE